MGVRGSTGTRTPVALATALEIAAPDEITGGSPNPTHAVDVTQFIDKGIDSLKQHRAYIANLGSDFDPDEFLRSGSLETGKLFGCKNGVSFEVIWI